MKAFSEKTERLLAHLIINFSEGSEETQDQITKLLGLDEELVDHLTNTLICDDDDGVWELKEGSDE